MTEATLMEPATGAPVPELTRKRFSPGETEHFRALEFLEEEAALLDDGRLLDWLELLDAELIYRMPTRETRYAGKGDGFAPAMYHFDENKATVSMKAKRLIMFESAWAENPPSRTRRFVTNVRVYPGGTSGELQASTSILMLRTRDNVEFVSARREDVLIERSGDLKLKHRTILVDQAVLQTSNLAVFL